MKKQVKIIIAAGVVLALLAGTLIFLLTLPDVQSDYNNETSTGAAALISKSSKDIERIVVNNSGGKYTLMPYRTVYETSDVSSDTASDSPSSDTGTESVTIFTMQEHNEYMIDYDKAEELAYCCSNLAATRTINSKGKADSEYGLDSPRSTVEIRFSDGNEIKVQVGNDAPGDEGTYVRMNDEKAVYLVDSSSVSSMLVEKLQMFDKTLLEALSDEDELKSIHVSGSGRKTPLTIKSSTLSILSAFYMSSPSRAACDDYKIETLCDSSIFPLVADSVVKIDVTESDIKKYGLSEPYYIFETTTSLRKEKLIVSKPDDSGDCYIMADGGKIIYKTTRDVIDFMGSDGSDYTTSKIIYPNVADLKTAAFSYSGKTDKYITSHETTVNEDEKEIINTTVQLSGEKISESSFDIMLRNLSSLTRSDKAPGIDKNAVPVLTVEFVYENGEGTDTLKLFEKNGKVVVTLNDAAVGTTELETAKTLVDNAEALSKNKDIAAFAEDEDVSGTSETYEATE